MPVSIDQRPLYTPLPIGQQIIFSVSEPTIVASRFKVKFIAEVHVSNTAINLSSTADVIGTFKTTPNNAGVGIFDLRPILETFVKPDSEPSKFGAFKGITANTNMFPIHLVDKFSLSDKSIKYFAIQFKIEYAETATGSVLPPTEGSNTGNAVNSVQYTMFNGVLQYDDVLTLSGNDYGYDLQLFELISPNSQFLTNAPTTQYARLTDYGTLPFLNYIPLSSAPATSVTISFISITYYKADGTSAGTGDSIPNIPGTGGSAGGGGADVRLNYVGAFPGNLQNWSANFATAVTNNLAYYTVQAKEIGIDWGKLYTINIVCPNIKGYEAIRLTWLNQWGVWDYYTFNMKSTRSTKTKRTSYTQLGGTWNESTFKIAGWKGGKKNFRVNSTEKIKLNTDFVTEAEGVWFEELINSPEVYIVNGFSTDVSNTITNKYVEPVRLTTSSYVKKTIANDKLMQYTIEIEKSKMKRTQAV